MNKNTIQKKYYIYKLCNTKNLKVYIGQTCSPEKRFYAQLYKGEKIKQAIQEIGWENFYVVKLESTANQKRADRLEDYYIRLFDSVNNGYNSTYNCHPPRYSRRSDHRNAAASKTMSLSKWYWNPETGESMRLIKGNVPEGFIPGRGSSKLRVKCHSFCGNKS